MAKDGGINGEDEISSFYKLVLNIITSRESNRF
jgi:hypothetical protein